jgi:hypothetical protein
MSHAQVRTGLDDLSLQAEMAGAALGCHFSSSAEYEAALIAERRKAGAYRIPVWRRAELWVMVAVAIVSLAMVW